MQDKIRMAKAKLIQVTAGQIAESQQHYHQTSSNSNSKSMLLNNAASSKLGGETTEVTTYEIYNQNDNANHMANLNAHENNNYQLHPSNHGAAGIDNRIITSASVGAGLNNLDSGFDVDSSTCTATTTSKFFVWFL